MLRLLKWASVLFALGIVVGAASAQTGSVNRYCDLGATPAKTQGLNSTNVLQGEAPSCTVTVYATGTSNKATLFANAASAPLSNPFTAQTSGRYIFYASTAGCYDITLSGGTAPNSYPSPVTLTGVCVSNGGGGGGSGTVTSFSATTVVDGNSLNFLIPSVTNPTTTPQLSYVFASVIPPGQFLGGECAGTNGQPFFRLLCPSDYPVFGASGSGHAQGAVPDPGATAGVTRFLREDATWATPEVGGSCPATTFSATPVYNFSASSCTSITLTGNITSSTSSGFSPGELYQVVFVQNSSGGHTSVAPINFKGGPATLNLAANGKTVCNYLAFTDSNLYLQGSCQWF